MGRTPHTRLSAAGLATWLVVGCAAGASPGPSVSPSPAATATPAPAGSEFPASTPSPASECDRAMIGTPRGLALLLPVCQRRPGPTPPGPSAPILLPGANPSTECERAMVAWPQAALEAGWGAETDRAEEALFNACTASEFTAFNEQFDALFRYPDTYLQYNCVDPLRIWPGSRLCESLSGD